MKKSGLTTVIIVSLVAMAFLPENAAHWVMIVTITVFLAIKGVSYYLDHKDEFSKRIRSVAKNSAKQKPETEPELKFVIIQMSHRITDKLHSAFPEGSWHWIERPTQKHFAQGGRVRIATKNTGEFSEADVIMDAYGRIEVQMLKTDSITKIVKTTDKNADTNYTIDADTWYSQCAQKVLTDIITDLNARGTKTLCIRQLLQVVL